MSFATVIVILLFSTGGFAFDNLDALRSELERTGSIERLLNRAPQEFKNNLLVMFRSQSLQEASCKNPRIISFSNDGHLVFSFNGDPSQEGFEALEAREFDPTYARFIFEELLSGSDAQNRQAHLNKNYPDKHLQIYDRSFRAGKNADACMACHSPSRPKAQGFDPRDNWRAYPFWQGALGALDDNPKPKAEGFDDSSPASVIFSPLLAIDDHIERFRDFNEKSVPNAKCVEIFRNSWKQNERYKHLDGLELLLDRDRPAGNYAYNRLFTHLSTRLNARRVARMISEHPSSAELRREVVKMGGFCPGKLSSDLFFKLLGEPSFILAAVPGQMVSGVDLRESWSDGISGESFYQWLLNETLDDDRGLAKHFDIHESLYDLGQGAYHFVPKSLRRSILNIRLIDQAGLCKGLD